MKRLIKRFLGLFPGTTLGSRYRNAFSYSAMLASILLLLALFGLLFVELTVFSRYVIICLSLIYFYETTIGVIRLVSENFQIDPVRLARDIGISTIFAIMAFAYFYQGVGIRDTLSGDISQKPGEYIYFSAVTFSTLGFGDFRPVGQGQFVAAFQAIYGNLHLGMLVGAVYLAIQVYGVRGR